jgi:sortase A
MSATQPDIRQDQDDGPPPPVAPKRKRSKVKRVLRWVSSLLILGGLLLVVDAVLTVLWQEPLTALQAKHRQSVLSKDLDQLEVQARKPSVTERTQLASFDSDRRRIAFLARSLRKRSKDGAAVGRITIPKIGAKFVVVNGTDTADLEKGPGLYSGRSFPGEPGTIAIAGHRTTYLAPFRHVDELHPGDSIKVQMPYATFTYRVQEQKVVLPTDIGILKRRGYDRLVLTACTPLFSASHRIVIFARLVNTKPAVDLSGSSKQLRHVANSLKLGPPSHR